MNTIGNEKIFMISAFIMIAVFLIRMPVMCRPRKFRYEYSAKTDFYKTGSHLCLPDHHAQGWQLPLLYRQSAVPLGKKVYPLHKRLCG